MNTRILVSGACTVMMFVGLLLQSCGNQSDGGDDQDAGTDTETDSMTSTGTDSNDTNTNTNGETETETEMETEAETEAETETETETETDTGPGFSLSLPARGAFYYPWFPQTWSVNGSHVFYRPTLGYYSSDEADVVDQHIADMDYAKIDVAIASWWGIDTQNEATRIPLLLDRTIANGSDLKWSFYYEQEGFHDPTVEELKTDLEYVMNTYADHEAIARINGKPVIFVYGGDCDTASRWSQASEGKWYVSLKVSQGFKDCPDQPATWHQYGPAAPAQEHAGYSYVIAPGFWRADQASALLGRDIDRWYQHVAAMVASDEPWQLVTTFNEWGEGTAVESAAEWESVSGYGQYLDALHSDGVL